MEYTRAVKECNRLAAANPGVQYYVVRDAKGAVSVMTLADFLLVRRTGFVVLHATIEEGGVKRDIYTGG